MTKHQLRLTGMLAAMLVAAVSLAVAADLPTEVTSKDPNIRYVGRWDMAGEKGPTAGWTASEIMAKFKGTAISAKLSGSGYFQIVVDGQPTGAFGLKKDQEIYELAAGLENKEHVVQIFRRNELQGGAFSFQGFLVEKGAKLLPLPAAPDKRILLIGDSITCGYGNETTGSGNPADKQNGYMTYGPITARSFGAEVQVIAWSGRKLWGGNTMPELYDTIYTGCKTKYDPKSWIPDVVVIDLGTNDMGNSVPDEKGWTDAGKAFIKTIRATAPDAHIFVATGPMWIKNQDTWNKYTKAIVKDSNDAGDKKVHHLIFPNQDTQKDGMGSDWHPNLTTHKKMAVTLTAVIEKELGWKAAVGTSQPASAPAKDKP